MFSQLANSKKVNIIFDEITHTRVNSLNQPFHKSQPANFTSKPFPHLIVYYVDYFHEHKFQFSLKHCKYPEFTPECNWA